MLGFDTINEILNSYNVPLIIIALFFIVLIIITFGAIDERYKVREKLKGL